MSRAKKPPVKEDETEWYCIGCNLGFSSATITERHLDGCDSAVVRLA